MALYHLHQEHFNKPISYLNAPEINTEYSPKLFHIERKISIHCCHDIFGLDIDEIKRISYDRCNKSGRLIQPVSTWIFIWVLSNSWGEGSLSLSLWKYLIQIELVSVRGNFKNQMLGEVSLPKSITLLIQRIWTFSALPPFTCNPIKLPCPGTSSFNPRKWKSFLATTEKQHSWRENVYFMIPEWHNVLWHRNISKFVSFPLLRSHVIKRDGNRNFKSFTGEIVLNFHET